MRKHYRRHRMLYTGMLSLIITVVVFFIDMHSKWNLRFPESYLTATFEKSIELFGFVLGSLSILIAASDKKFFVKLKEAGKFDELIKFISKVLYLLGALFIASILAVLTNITIVHYIVLFLTIYVALMLRYVVIIIVNLSKIELIKKTDNNIEPLNVDEELKKLNE